MKKYLFLAIALLGLASCAKEDLTNGNEPIHNGEIEESYIAINLSASDVTRAETTTPVFEDGEAAERAVNHVDFFFFDEAGNPFNVVGNPAVAPGGGRNHLRAIDVTFTKDSEGTDDDDISDTSSPVLLLQTYKGHYPSQIVAVLNWSTDTNKSYSLDELHNAVDIQGTFNSTKYFVMSNAVYASSGKTVNATALPESSIKKTKDEAKDVPISIYVERVAAKVAVSTNSDSNVIKLNKPFDGMISVGELGQKDVYAKILGWELYNDNTKSYLLKQIDPTWSVDDIGFNWNDSPWYRSYWATSLGRPAGDDNSFQMKYDNYEAEGFTTEYGFAMGGATYVGENTNGKQSGTKVILKAQLVDAAENGQPLEIASWYGNKYVGEENLLTAVANSLKYTLFYYDEANRKYIGITPEDLQCVAGGTTEAPTGVDANEVYFQLSDKQGCGKNRLGGWYKLVEGEYKPVADNLNPDKYSVEATNGYLKTIQPGILYKDGETFYYIDIKHLGAPNSLAEYGVVRNHIYNVIINSIGGYGSPVYVGTSDIIDPKYPDIEDAEESFVSAQINILSWRLVNQTVDIQPQN